MTSFLDESSDQVGKWGERDCALWVGAWVERQTGKDGGGAWRGTYETESECLALLEREGGLLAVMSTGAAVAGLEATEEPARGDIAVVRVTVLAGEPLLAAIALGGSRWAAMSSSGQRVIRAEPVKAWRVPDAASVLRRRA